MCVGRKIILALPGNLVHPAGDNAGALQAAGGLVSGRPLRVVRGDHAILNGVHDTGLGRVSRRVCLKSSSPI